MYRYAIAILRSQPFHLEHKKLLETAHQKAKKVIVVLGSARSSRSILNPFPFDLRKQMILSCFPEVEIVPVRDYFYNYPAWLNEVKSKVQEFIKEGTKPKEICLCGAKKDYDTQNYLTNLSQFWAFEEHQINSILNATDIRANYFSGRTDWQNDVPKEAAEYLIDFYTNPNFKILQKEFFFVQDYIKKTQTSQYFVQLQTCDSVCVHAGHILVVRRKGMPGQGQIALPGGFVEHTETAQNAVFRELKEETLIDIPKDRLRDFLKGEENGYRFDHPKRDVRGRIATQAFFIKIPDKLPQPIVKGGDDAKKAWWMPYYDLFRKEEEMFSDHIHIAVNLMNKLGQTG